MPVLRLVSLMSPGGWVWSHWCWACAAPGPSSGHSMELHTLFSEPDTGTPATSPGTHRQHQHQPDQGRGGEEIYYGKLDKKNCIIIGSNFLLAAELCVLFYPVDGVFWFWEKRRVSRRVQERGLSRSSQRELIWLLLLKQEYSCNSIKSQDYLEIYQINVWWIGKIFCFKYLRAKTQ